MNSTVGHHVREIMDWAHEAQMDYAQDVDPDLLVADTADAYFSTHALSESMKRAIRRQLGF